MSRWWSGCARAPHGQVQQSESAGARVGRGCGPSTDRSAFHAPEGNSYAQQVRAKLDEIAATQMPVRGLDPSNPDDIRAAGGVPRLVPTHGKLDVDLTRQRSRRSRRRDGSIDRDADHRPARAVNSMGTSWRFGASITHAKLRPPMTR